MPKGYSKPPPLWDPLLEKEFLENCKDIDDFFYKLDLTTKHFSYNFISKILRKLFSKAYVFDHHIESNEFVTLYETQKYNLRRYQTNEGKPLFIWVNNKKYMFYTLHELIIKNSHKTQT